MKVIGTRRSAIPFIGYAVGIGLLAVGIALVAEAVFGQYPLIRAYAVAMLGGAYLSASLMAIGILRENVWMVLVASIGSLFCIYEASIPTINAAAERIPGAYQFPSFFSLVFG